MGVIYANENTSDGIAEVLKDLQQYQAHCGNDEERKYETQGFAADQLSVERAVNAVMQVSNAFTPEYRFDGMHFEIAEIHQVYASKSIFYFRYTCFHIMNCDFLSARCH